jgi:hypothetical protein
MLEKYRKVDGTEKMSLPSLEVCFFYDETPIKIIGAHESKFTKFDWRRN